MYNDYFGFNENPFSIAPNPRYLYMSTMHQEALAHLVYGTTSKGCIVLLTGEVGTGKTTISRYFLEKLPRTTDIAVITNPKLTGDELLASVCDEFQIKVATPEPSTKNYIDSLNDFLLKSYSANRQTVLVIDEAQNLDLDVLELLRLLTNLETDQQKLLKIVLLGQSELGSILEQPEQEQINQRITSRYHLKGLKRADVEAYMSHRIMVAGGGRSTFFTRSAVNEIYNASRGIPRLINSLCDHALLGAYTESKEQVDKKIVQKAATELFGKNVLSRTGNPRFRLILAAGVILMVAILGLWLGATFLLNSSQEFDKRSLVERLSELGKPPEPEQPPTLDEPEDQPQLSMDQPTSAGPALSSDADVATESESPGEKTKITISPIEINE